MSKPFFSPGSASQMYERTRDSEGLEDVRALLETWWMSYAPYCGDVHFLSDARTHFVERTWELYLSALLLEAGFRLERPPSNGPDFKLITDRGSVWIEAVAPTSGTGDDEAKRIISWERKSEHGYSATYTLNKDKTVLRYTGKLRDKFRQYLEFRKRGIVGESDPFIVAINGAAIDDSDIEDEYPDIVRAVYPVGEAVMHVPIGDDREAWTSMSMRTEIKKACGKPVSTKAFLSDDYTGVSMVFFSSRDMWNVPDLAGREVVAIHNSRARNPLPRGTFPWGREYWVGGQSELRLEEHRPDRRVGSDEEPG